MSLFLVLRCTISSSCTLRTGFVLQGSSAPATQMHARSHSKQMTLSLPTWRIYTIYRDIGPRCQDLFGFWDKKRTIQRYPEMSGARSATFREDVFLECHILFYLIVWLCNLYQLSTKGLKCVLGRCLVDCVYAIPRHCGTHAMLRCYVFVKLSPLYAIQMID